LLGYFCSFNINLEITVQSYASNMMEYPDSTADCIVTDTVLSNRQDGGFKSLCTSVAYCVGREGPELYIKTM